MVLKYHQDMRRQNNALVPLLAYERRESMLARIVRSMPHRRRRFRIVESPKYGILAMSISARISYAGEA